MTLASPMTHKTPLDLAESRLGYLLSRAQEGVTTASTSSRPEFIEFFGHLHPRRNSNTSNNHNALIVTTPRTSMHIPPSTQSPALLQQIKGIVNLLRPYVVRQQRLQHGERQKERQKERSWDRADKYMRQQGSTTDASGLWRVESISEDNDEDMEDDQDDIDDGDLMDTNSKLTSTQSSNRRPLGRRMDADETEVALESLLNGLSLLEASQKQQQQQPQPSPFAPSAIHPGDMGHGNLDSKQGEKDVDDALPDLLEQVQQVLQAIKLNETG